MTTINVVLGTPHIEVDPVTSVVAITLAGPQGPPGASGGSATWGTILGDLEDQTDLQAALDDKQDAGAAAGGVLAGTYPNPSFAADMATQAELNAVAAAAVNDGDSAGGVLAGTYPNPSFAADMATQTELDAVSTVANAAIAPGDAAGGDLTGTYPNPTFAADMATQTELDAVSTVANDAVPKALFDANTILYATSDNTPVALTVAASRVVGRKASGDIDDMTGAETAAVLAGEVFKQAQEINAQIGTSYTLVAGDAGKLVTMTNGSGSTLDVPQDSAATIAVGTYVDISVLGAGQLTVQAGSGATLRVSGLTAKSRAQYARLGVQKIAANTWQLFGDLAAS